MKGVHTIAESITYKNGGSINEYVLKDKIASNIPLKLIDISKVKVDNKDVMMIGSIIIIETDRLKELLEKERLYDDEKTNGKD